MAETLISPAQVVCDIIASHIYTRTGRVAKPESDDHLFDDLGLDSLDRVELCFAIEERFGTPEINESRVFFVRDLVKVEEARRAG